MMVTLVTCSALIMCCLFVIEIAICVAIHTLSSPLIPRLVLLPHEEFLNCKSAHEMPCTVTESTALVVQFINVCGLCWVAASAFRLVVISLPLYNDSKAFFQPLLLDGSCDPEQNSQKRSGTVHHCLFTTVCLTLELQSLYTYCLLNYSSQ